MAPRLLPMHTKTRLSSWIISRSPRTSPRMNFLGFLLLHTGRGSKNLQTSNISGFWLFAHRGGGTWKLSGFPNFCRGRLINSNLPTFWVSDFLHDRRETWKAGKMEIWKLSNFFAHGGWGNPESQKPRKLETLKLQPAFQVLQAGRQKPRICTLGKSEVTLVHTGAEGAKSEVRSPNWTPG